MDHIFGGQDTIEKAQALLRSMSVADLLRAAYSLTHRMENARHIAKAQRKVTIDDLRAQRDLIDAEILRRTGEQS